MNSIIHKADKKFHADEIFPPEIWTRILSFLDVQTLFSSKDTCRLFSSIARPLLFSVLVEDLPLSLVTIAREKNSENVKIEDVIFKLHLYIDEAVERTYGQEPTKWTDEMHEWVGYDSSLDDWTNQEAFQRTVGRKGRALSIAWVTWNSWVQEEKRSCRRQLAVIWSVLGRLFPFSHAENREWKRRRSHRLLTLEDDSMYATSAYNQHQSSPDENIDEDSDKEDNGNNHQILSDEEEDLSPGKKNRRQRRRRINRGKGIEDFHRTILAPYVTPEHYFRSTSRTPNPYAWSTSQSDALRRFWEDPVGKVLRFPPGLTSYQRKELHREAHFLGGLKSMSFGKGEGRFLVVMKEDVEEFDD
ncbi:uncharacterized protein VTP21DRAFT_6915 [Calcarisporiella thermophila]|uniref:uncharacterized protein n=1 Tax=Calcarisporiella thermophila TaxID=911321 RepID=UPI003742DE00